jgi:hypothetical protein
MSRSGDVVGIDLRAFVGTDSKRHGNSMTLLGKRIVAQSA